MTTPDPDDATPSPTQPAAPAEPTEPTGSVPPATKRPLIERLGLAVIALGLAALFGVIAGAAFVGGEPFLGVMGAIGMLMVLWVGVLTLVRG
jgi:hypothetical protein